MPAEFGEPGIKNGTQLQQGAVQEKADRIRRPASGGGGS
jgi:hypothetical protein